MIDVFLGVMLFLITAYVVAVGFLSSWFMLRMRWLLRQQKEAGEMLGQMVSSIYDSIDEKEARIMDLMYRTNLLEATLRRESITDRVEGAPLAVVKRDVRRDVMSPMTKSPKGKISESELVLLNSLLEQPRRVSEITQSMGKSREHTSRMLGKLVRSGLLERSNSGVGVVYGLTASGHEFVM